MLKKIIWAFILPVLGTVIFGIQVDLQITGEAVHINDGAPTHGCSDSVVCPGDTIIYTIHIIVSPYDTGSSDTSIILSFYAPNIETDFPELLTSIIESDIGSADSIDTSSIDGGIIRWKFDSLPLGSTLTVGCKVVIPTNICQHPRRGCLMVLTSIATLVNSFGNLNVEANNEFLLDCCPSVTCNYGMGVGVEEENIRWGENKLYCSFQDSVVFAYRACVETSCCFIEASNLLIYIRVPPPIRVSDSSIWIDRGLAPPMIIDTLSDNSQLCIWYTESIPFSSCSTFYFFGVLDTFIDFETVDIDSYCTECASVGAIWPVDSESIHRPSAVESLLTNSLLASCGCSCLTCIVKPHCDLEIHKEKVNTDIYGEHNDIVYAGDTIQWLITVSNNGLSGCDTIVVLDSLLPSCGEIVSIYPPTTDIDTSADSLLIIRWSLDSIIGGRIESLYVYYTIGEECIGEKIINTARVNCADDENTDNDEDADTTLICGELNYSLECRLEGDGYWPGEDVAVCLITNLPFALSRWDVTLLPPGDSRSVISDGSDTIFGETTCVRFTLPENFTRDTMYLDVVSRCIYSECSFGEYIDTISCFYVIPYICDIYVDKNYFYADRENVSIHIVKGWGGGDIEVYIYDSGGDLVRKFRRSISNGGTQEVSFSWDGEDENGNKCAPGVYFITVNCDKEWKTYKVILYR